MAVELTVVLRFDDGTYVPSEDDIEFNFDCEVIEYEEQEV